MVSKNFIFEDNNENKNKFSNIEPILIFGIPRTGTTLVETIITSGEEKIYNAGENFILQKSLQNLQLNKKISENRKICKYRYQLFEKNYYKRLYEYIFYKNQKI